MLEGRSDPVLWQHRPVPVTFNGLNGHFTRNVIWKRKVAESPGQSLSISPLLMRCIVVTTQNMSYLVDCMTNLYIVPPLHPMCMSYRLYKDCTYLRPVKLWHLFCVPESFWYTSSVFPYIYVFPVKHSETNGHCKRSVPQEASYMYFLQLSHCYKSKNGVRGTVLTNDPFWHLFLIYHEKKNAKKK